MNKAARVARRFLARTVPVDKNDVRELAKELEAIVARALTGKTGPTGKVKLGHYPFSIRTVDGDRKKIWILLQAIPSRDFRYYVSGGLGTAQGHTVVVVNVNGSLDAEVIWKATNARTTQSFLYPILLHELTHAADIFAPGLDGMSEDDAQGNAAYYNNVSELRAYTQEVVDEVEQRFSFYPKLQKTFGARAFTMLLNFSNTWTEVSPHWTKANQQRVIKTVYQMLDRWQDAQKSKTGGRTAWRVATRYIEARGTLGPIIHALEAGKMDADLAEQALMELEVRRNGERWRIEADWMSALGPRHQSRAETIIRALARLVNDPGSEVEAPLKTLAFELKWLQGIISKADASTFQHGAFEIVPHKVSKAAVNDALEALDKAYKALHPKFPQVLYGRVFIVPTLAKGHSTIAMYTPEDDIVYLSIKAKNTTGDVHALCHELGHRYHHRFWKDKRQQDEFMRLSTTTEYGETVFDKELREKIATEYLDVAKAKRDRKAHPDASDLLLTWLEHVSGTPEWSVAQKLGVRFVKGEDVERELRKAVVGTKDFTVRTKEVVRTPELVTKYGGKSWMENFAEAFAHYAQGLALPPGVGAIMEAL